MIAASRKAFAQYGVEDRVKLIEGPADKTSVGPVSFLLDVTVWFVSNANLLSRLQTLQGEFDLIFVDANKDGYATYVQTILDQKLLSPNGIILCDNGESILLSLATLGILLSMDSH